MRDGGKKKEEEEALLATLRAWKTLLPGVKETRKVPFSGMKGQRFVLGSQMGNILIFVVRLLRFSNIILDSLDSKHDKFFHPIKFIERSICTHLNLVHASLPRYYYYY